MVKLRELRLPELNKNTNIQDQKALVFDSPCQYDIIIGSDLLFKVGIKMDYEESVTEWFDAKLKLRDPKGLSPGDLKDMKDSLCVQAEGEVLGEDWLDYVATGILDTKYEEIDMNDGVDTQKHLGKQQCKELFNVLNGHAALFG